MVALPLLLSLASMVSAARLTISIPPTTLLPKPAVLPPSTHATLYSTGAPATAYLSRRNDLTFTNITVGTYLLTLHCRDYLFDPYRVDVETTLPPADAHHDAPNGKVEEVIKVWQSFRGNEWDNKGASMGEGRGSLAIAAEPKAKKEYYQARTGFDVLSFFKNPMILMALFSLVLIVGLPYITENMDPETKAELEEYQKQSRAPNKERDDVARATQQLTNFDFAGWMAGATSTDKAQAQDKGTTSGSSSGGGARRRG